MKNSLLIFTAFAALSACSSNYNKNTAPMQNLPTKVDKHTAVVRTTVDPQPGINEHVNDIGRNAAVIHSIPDAK